MPCKTTLKKFRPSVQKTLVDDSTSAGLKSLFKKTEN